MHDVFLSYAHEDHAEVMHLVTAFQQGGLSVFWDRELRPGQKWSDVIETALNSAKAVVVVWSRASAASSWVKAEAAAAMDRDALVPVRIDDVSIPLPFGQIQTADLSVDDPEHFAAGVHQVITALADMAGREKAPPVAPASMPYRPRRTGRLDWRHALFSLEGRLDRKEFWLGILILVSIQALPFVLIFGSVGDTASDAGLQAKTMVAMGFWFLLLYPTLALFIKRLHDFDWSGWWSVVFLFFSFLNRALTATVQYGPNNDVKTAAEFITYFGMLAVVVLGLVKGTPGPNRYGPPRTPRPSPAVRAAG